MYRSVCLVLVAGCSASPPPGPSQAQTPSPAPSAEPTAQRAPAPGEPASPAEARQIDVEPLPEGCYSNVDLGLPLEELLNGLAAECVSGMSPILPRPLVVPLRPSGRKDVPVTITDVKNCIQAIAVGERGVSELALKLVDRSDRAYAEDTLRARFALIPAEGPQCFPNPGVYRVVVSLKGGAGRVAVQVWKTSEGFGEGD